MKKSLKKIISMISMAAVISTSVGSQVVFADDTAASGAAINESGLTLENATLSKAQSNGPYATNPDSKVGKEATITIDGTTSGWSDDMLIAQGAAWDLANCWKGGHENGVMDSYSLYGAWDDENLYIAWQMVNTSDTWNTSDGNESLSDGGALCDEPLLIALNVGNKTPLTGKMVSGCNDKYIWNREVGYKTPVDHLLIMSAKLLGSPAMFTAANDNGECDYSDKENCQLFKTLGVQVKTSDTCLPDKLFGLKGSQSVSDATSESTEWVDLKNTPDKRAHDTKYDHFYEMSIPLKALGIDKAYIEEHGIGAMQISEKGSSGTDCLPHDPCMIDNVMGDYAKDASTSHEKDDLDVITVPLASIGKLQDSSVVTPPKPIETKKDAKITDFKADSKDVKTGDEVKFTCTATDAKSYSFKIDGEDADSSEVKDNVLTHKFSKAGKYKVEVTAKAESGAKDDTDSIDVEVKDNGDNDDKKEVSVKDFKSDKTSAKVDDEVNLTAEAEGGSGKYEYKFTSVDGDNNEETISDYSAESKATWEPQNDGTYTLNVYVKEKGAKDSTAVKKSIKDFKVAPKADDKEKKLSIDSFKADPDDEAIKVNTEVKFEAKASEDDDVTYKFEVSKDGGKNQELEANDEGNTASWTPSKEGSYKITVTASKDGYTDAVKTKTYKVEAEKTPNDENKEFDVSVTSNDLKGKKVGDSIEVKANPVNQEGDVTYKFVVNNSKSKYSQEDFSSKDTFTFKPEEAGEYNVLVIAKAKNGTVQSIPITINVAKSEENKKEKDMSLNITVPSKKAVVNSAFEIVPDLQNANGNIEYTLYLNDSKQGTKLSIKNGKLSWTPDKEGEYTIKIVAKDEDGNEASSNDISVNVNKPNKDVDVKHDSDVKKTADGAPLKILSILASIGGIAAVFSRKKQR